MFDDNGVYEGKFYDGIGGTPFLNFRVIEGEGFRQTDLDANLTACCIRASNAIGKGSPGDRLFGNVVWVSQELQSGTTTPVRCAVQARGVAIFKCARPFPLIGCGVEVDGRGKVRDSSAGYGVVISLGEGTCRVWLG